MSLRDWGRDELVAIQGKADCQDPRCSRVDGQCRGYHCANCGQPSSYQGHYGRCADGEWGFPCEPSEDDDA